MISKRSIAACLALLVVLCSAVEAQAHNGISKYIDVVTTDDGMLFTVRVNVTEVAAGTGLGVDVDAAALERRADDVTAFLTGGLVVEAGGESCNAWYGDPELTQGEDATFVTVTASYVCGEGTLTLRDDSLHPGDTTHNTVVHIVEGDTTVLRGGSAAMALTAAAEEAPSLLATARTFFIEGGIHLITGYDHMLFLLSLLFAAGLLARKRGTKPAVRNIALVVTAFTVGHSITLVVASLGLVSLNAQMVEVAIAASIVAVALMNVLRPESVDARPWIALSFGLIHGFGFSSVLAEVGLPRGQRFVALASFNLGIEVLQLAFVAVAILPLAWIAKREALYRMAVMRIGSLGIAALAAVWVVQRLLGS